jgi:hypothetical protein
MSSEGKKRIIKRMDETIEHVASKFFADPTLGWILSNIPDYGPAIRSIMTVVEGTILRRRMSDLFDSIQEETLLIDQTKIDLAYFETEECYDIIRRIFEYTLRTRDKSKIKLYARILVRTPILGNAVFRHTVEDFLLMLVELSPADLVLAREVFKQQQTIPDDFANIEQNELKTIKESGWSNLPSITGMNKSEFSLSVTKLVRTGLLRQVIGTYASYIGDAYRITPFFRDLMKFIEKLE